MARPFIISTCLSPLAGKSLTSLIEVFISKWTLKWRFRMRVVCACFCLRRNFRPTAVKTCVRTVHHLQEILLQRQIYYTDGLWTHSHTATQFKNAKCLGFFSSLSAQGTRTTALQFIQGKSHLRNGFKHAYTLSLGWPTELEETRSKPDYAHAS